VGFETLAAHVDLGQDNAGLDAGAIEGRGKAPGLGGVDCEDDLVTGSQGGVTVTLHETDDLGRADDSSGSSTISTSQS
jgi:hypothetical protein